ncbi:hypothetical protein D7X33_07380 [Butyricicoccus sp. 1XD8-22]|nr:hypothetical protein D7X33_07380 [Butyricicoccus sp. 1XD8-22]
MITALPEITQYIFPGMLFIEIFFFFTDRKLPTTGIIIPSVCISYVIKSFLTFLAPEWLHSLPMQIIVSVLFAYVSAKTTLSQTFNRVILPRLGINRTANDSFWTDLITNDMWIMVYGEKVVYYGAVDLVDDKGASHFLVLRNVIVMDFDGNVLNSGEDPERRMMFDMTKYKRYEIISKHETADKIRRLLFGSANKSVYNKGD